MPSDITPDMKMISLKLMLRLRAFAPEGITQCEKMRSAIRIAILTAENDSDATAVVESTIVRYNKVLSKLDGSYDVRREQKRRRREEQDNKVSSLVDLEAGSGEDTPEETDGDD